ncbi:MAG: hypothetical protein K6F66_09980 [Pseudobutyrivibrio sp.]|nr:hypothetical protein [Pseudobutyrivibrio sp.]
MNLTNLKNKIFILVFLGILVFPWIAGGLLRLIAPTVYTNLTSVETENRDMAQINWQDLLNTGESVSSYVDDHIPFRYTMLNLYKGMNDGIEERYAVVETAIGSKLYTAPVEETAEEDATNKPIVPGEEVIEAVASVEEPPVDSNYYPLHVYQDVIVGRDGWLFLYGENEIECYQGTNLLTEEEMQSYAAKVNQLQSICSAQGKELYFYIAPNKSQVYSQYMPTVDIVNTYKREQQLHSYMVENCTTPYLYPLTESLGATTSYQTYYKYDSHWNHLGALYGTNALYAAMGIEQTEPTQWITGTQDAEKYELYTYMGIPDSDINRDDIEFTMDYRPEVTVDGLNLDAMVCHTTSTGANPKRLCLIGDSFRVNMMPYLAKDFTSCTFAHRDYMSEVTSDIKSADIIVIEAVERYDYEAFATAQRVINALSQ